MHNSRIVSEFSLAEKPTPPTHNHTPTLPTTPNSLLPSLSSLHPCSFCAEHLSKVSELRKR